MSELSPFGFIPRVSMPRLYIPRFMTWHQCCEVPKIWNLRIYHSLLRDKGRKAMISTSLKLAARATWGKISHLLKPLLFLVSCIPFFITMAYYAIREETERFWRAWSFYAIHVRQNYFFSSVILMAWFIFVFWLLAFSVFLSDFSCGQISVLNESPQVPLLYKGEMLYWALWGTRETSRHLFLGTTSH